VGSRMRLEMKCGGWDEWFALVRFLLVI